jgi:indolepyruvate decarboxylase
MKRFMKVSMNLVAVVVILFSNSLPLKVNAFEVNDSLLTKKVIAQNLNDDLKQSKISFATTPMDKGIVSESHPQYLGIYSGAWSSPPGLNVAVEAADLLLDIGGVVFEDFNTTFWTSQAAPQKLLTLGDNFVRQGNTIFTGVSLQDMLAGLTARLSDIPEF